MSEEEFDSQENQDDYDYDTSSGDFSNEGNAAVMKNFFDLTKYVKNKITYWQGFTYINGEKTLTHSPVGPDSFIYSIIGLIDAVLSQHNSISFTGQDQANRILFESIQALDETILEEPQFNKDRYSMLLEEFDHMLELFMGLVIKGHGKNVAIALQAGIVSEQNNIPVEKTGMMEKFKQRLTS